MLPQIHTCKIFFISLLTTCFLGYSQSNKFINQQISTSIFKEFEPKKKQIKPFIKPQKKLLNQLNPFIYVSDGLLFVYQNIFSEQIQATCCYQLSCSENMKYQIKQNGIFTGILSGLNQLGNCAHSVANDYPNYKITVDGKINNTID